jgi:ribosome maturation factor RimP
MEQIKEGSIVKIRLQSEGMSERVWAIVQSVDGDTFTAKLDNEPVSNAFKFGEIIKDIPMDFVLDVFDSAG